MHPDKFIMSRHGNRFFDEPANDNTALTPELWANEGLAILEENMVLGNLVFRDFENVIAKFGDVVNTRKPRKFTALRKTDADPVTIQPAISDNIPVPLDQHAHTSFMIMDGEESTSFKNLVDLYLRPGVISLASYVDKVLSGQAIRFIQYTPPAGGLGQMIGSNAANYLLNARQALNVNLIPVDYNRHVILNPYSETAVLENPNFTAAYFVGDEGTALRTASLGSKYGMNIFMAQNQPYVPALNTTVTGAVNHAGGYPAGTQVLTVSGFTAAISAGTWITIAGDNTPLQVVSAVTGSNPTTITLQNPISNAVLQSAVITVYVPGAINLTAGYPAGYSEEILVDGFTVWPFIGQPVTFGADNINIYSIIGTDGSSYITVDRPIVNNLTNGQSVNIGPAGSYNFAFHRNALALVSRPLALPRVGVGALAANVTYNNLSMRVVMSYQGKDQGTLVTLDMLLGVAIFEKMAGVLLCAAARRMMRFEESPDTAEQGAG